MISLVAERLHIALAQQIAGPLPTKIMLKIMLASAEMVEIRDLNVVLGRFFTQREEAAATHVAVIGDETEQLLFS